MKLTTLAIPTTHNTVTSADQSADRNKTSRNGTRNTRIDTPVSDRMLPASTIPAIFAGGEISRRSSMSPTPKITAAAATTPTTSVRAASTWPKSSISAAASTAATIPAIIAAPPAVGVGASCTWRSSGATTAPTRMARRRTSGTSANVTAAATTPTIR